MKTFVSEFSLLFLVLLTSSSTFALNREKMFSNALGLIIQKFYVKNAIQFDFLSVDVESWIPAAEIIENVSKYFHSEPVNIRFINGSEHYCFNLTRSTILFISTFAAFNLFEGNLRIKKTNYFNYRHFVIILNVNSHFDFTTLQATSMFYFANPLLYNEKIGQVRLYQFITTCESDRITHARIKCFNIFTKLNMKWESNTFALQEPMRNLKGCEFVVECSECLSEKMSQKAFFRGILKHLEIELSFNAIVVKNLSDIKKYSFSFEPIILSGATNHFHVFVYNTYEQTLIFSTGEPYSPFEKLIVPLDDEVWIALAITFLTGFMIILFVDVTQLSNSEIRPFIYGAQVKTPAFNMLIAFFGQGQNILPKGNFARYILMLYILFCLVVRTGYQGVQFEMIYKVMKLTAKACAHAKIFNEFYFFL